MGDEEKVFAILIATPKEWGSDNYKIECDNGGRCPLYGVSGKNACYGGGEFPRKQLEAGLPGCWNKANFNSVFKTVKISSGEIQLSMEIKHKIEIKNIK